MSKFMHKIQPIKLDKTRGKSNSDKATTKELHWVKSLAGALYWLGSGFMPQASYLSSFVQQIIPGQCVRDIGDINALLKELCKLKH